MPAIPAQFPRITRTALRRGFLAGTAWGLLFTAGMTGLTFFNCGVVCLDVVAVTAAISMAAGLMTLGPLAALTR